MSRVNKTKWEMKVKYIQALTPLAVAQVVDFGLDTVLKETVKNLSGGNTDEPGSYPVPRRTGDLARSVADSSPVRLLPELGYVWSNDDIASYNKAVHDGTKYTSPRRFLDDAVREKRPGIEDFTRKEILKAIGSVGRK